MEGVGAAAAGVGQEGGNKGIWYSPPIYRLAI